MKKAAFIGFIFRGWRCGLPRAQRALAMTPLQGVPRAGRCGHRPLRKRNKWCNGRATARVAPTEGYKECLAGGRTGASAPTDMWKRLRRAGLQEVRQNGPSGTPPPTDGVLMVPCAAGHMGPALQGVFVGQGPRALPGVREKSGSGRCRHRPLRKRNKRCNGRATARVAPTKVLQGVR